MSDWFAEPSGKCKSWLTYLGLCPDAVTGQSAFLPSCCVDHVNSGDCIFTDGTFSVLGSGEIGSEPLQWNSGAGEVQLSILGGDNVYDDIFNLKYFIRDCIVDSLKNYCNKAKPGKTCTGFNSQRLLLTDKVDAIQEK